MPGLKAGCPGIDGLAILRPEIKNMKIHRRITGLLSVALLALSAFQSLKAASVILVTNRDVYLCFRKTGLDGVGSTAGFDVEVDVGQASLFYNAPPGSTITFNQVSNALFGLATFDNLNDVSWSAAAASRLLDNGDPSAGTNTLWVTAPRPSPNTQSTPWVRNSTSSQSVTATKIANILNGARSYSGTVPAGSTNTTNSVIVPHGNGNEYDAFIGTGGNFPNGGAASFQGDVETTTPSDFISNPASGPSRCDFYQLRVGTGQSGNYLGYFELRTNGTAVFVAASAAVPQPTLQIVRTGTTNTISFTGAGYTYTLYSTNLSGLTAPTSTWPTNAGTVSGSGPLQFQDITSASNRVYRVGAH